jgi:hypothetical protein
MRATWAAAWLAGYSPDDHLAANLHGPVGGSLDVGQAQGDLLAEDLASGPHGGDTARHRVHGNSVLGRQLRPGRDDIQVLAQQRALPIRAELALLSGRIGVQTTSADEQIIGDMERFLACPVASPVSDRDVASVP